MPLVQRVFCQIVVIFITGVMWLGGFLTAARGCPYSIRDAGFIVREPKPCKLTVVVHDRTPAKDKLKEWLTEAAKTYLTESNVVAEVVNLDQQPPPEINKHFDLSARENLPPVLLVSPRDEAISLPGLGPDTIGEAAVQEVVRSAVISPQRKQLTAHIVTDWCVVVVVNGAEATENQRVARALSEARNAVLDTTTEMGVKIAKPPYVITLSPDDAAEQVLMWSSGLAPGDEAGPRIAVLFGMGRRVGPVLSAKNISRSMLTNIFLLLGRNCTCTTDPHWLIGPALPLVWSKDRQRQVYEKLGFDPNSPEVAATLGGAWTSVSSLESPDNKGSGETASTELELPAPVGPGYIEFSVEPDTSKLNHTPGGATDSPSAPPTIAQRSLHTVIVLAAILILVILGASAVLWLRHRND